MLRAEILSLRTCSFVFDLSQFNHQTTKTCMARQHAAMQPSIKRKVMVYEVSVSQPHANPPGVYWRRCLFESTVCVCVCVLRVEIAMRACIWAFLPVCVCVYLPVCLVSECARLYIFLCGYARVGVRACVGMGVRACRMCGGYADFTVNKHK